MPWARRLSLVGLLAGVLMLVWAAIQGGLRVTFVLIVPVLTGSGPFAALGGLLLILGAFGWLLSGTVLPVGQVPGPGDREGSSTVGQDLDTAQTERRSGGIILLGPIPIAWGSDRSTLLTIVLAAVTLMGLAVTLLLLLPP